MPGQEAVQFGVAIPQVFTEHPMDMKLIQDFVKRAEALDYHSLWVQEHLLGRGESLEPISLLCYVAGITSRIRLGTSVIVATTRNPVLLAKTFASLDHMSGGRLIIGVALGGRPAQYPLFGAPTEKRVRHFAESLEVMNALWTQSSPKFDGHFWQLDGEVMEPQPVQKPRPPIWFGGRHPDALSRFVGYGEGWMGAGSSTMEHFREHVGIINQALEKQGRDPSTFLISKRMYIGIDKDEAQAERRLREWFGIRYGNADLANRVAIWGSASKCVETLAEVVELGARHILLNQVFDDIEHLDAFKEEVIPALTG